MQLLCVVVRAHYCLLYLRRCWPVMGENEAVPEVHEGLQHQVPLQEVRQH